MPVSTEPKAKPDFSAVERTLTTGNYQAIVDRGLTPPPLNLRNPGSG